MRIPAQIIQYILTTVGRSVRSAHRNVVNKHGTKSTEHIKRTQASRVNSVAEMQVDEALKILAFESSSKVSPKLLSERYADYYSRNDASEGGGDYLQAKIKNAHQVLSEKVVRGSSANK